MSVTATFSIAPSSWDFGRIRVGNTSAPQPFTFTNTSPIIDLVNSNTVVFNLTGGGQVILGCGQGAANGTTVPLPSGFDVSRCLMFTTPGTGSGGSGTDQLEGVYVCQAPNGVFNTQWQQRSGAASTNPASTNYILAAWTLGAAVNLTTAGVTQELAFTTDQGDDLCFSFSSNLATGSTVPTPAGFAAAQSLNICGPASTTHSGNGLQYIHQCDLNGALLATLVYIDESAHVWGGGMNIFLAFYKLGGGVTTEAVANGTALLVPAVSTGVLAVIFGINVVNGTAFGIPAGFSGTVSGMPSAVFGVPSSSNIVHGFQLNTLAGTLYSGLYNDGLGHSWNIIADTLAVAVKVPNLQIVVDNIISNVGEFALSDLPAFPVTLNPGDSVGFACACTGAYQGFISYLEALTVFVENFPNTFIRLSYTGFLVSSAYIMTGATQGVLGGLMGVGGTASHYLAQLKSALSCEADAFWENQYDFDNASANTYVSKVFLRNEPSGDVTATMTDTSMISGTTSSVSCTTVQSGATDGNQLVTWMQFDFENNGESHRFKFLIQAGNGRVKTSMIILQYEQRGVVYEGS